MNKIALYELRRESQVKIEKLWNGKRYTSIAPIDILVNTFCDCLIDTYIDKNATFPPYLWLSCNISGERTTNACTQRLGNIFIQPIQIFVFSMKF
jgi:hypothetical protein